jgi:diphosphate-dependent phosphofructokinase
MNVSLLQQARYAYKPKLPGIFQHGISEIAVMEGEAAESISDQEKIRSLFPNTYGEREVIFCEGRNTSRKKKHVVGVILSGGQAPGGHNVVSGLYDALKATNPDNVLIGFKGGPSGLLEDKYIIFDDAYIDAYRNTGGFDIIGSGRTKMETEEQFETIVDVCRKHGMTAIVIIGGDDSNTNAAVLAEYMVAHKTGIRVIGCPKTIDGDLKNEDIEVSFGFDTATKTYSELVGNIERDCNSAKKYWHFIKVMGRSASHIALECALECQPNICLISEEIAEKKLSLSKIADYIADSVEKRAEKGMNYGVVIIPEGVVEFVPEFSALIEEINELLAGKKGETFNALPSWKEKYAFIEKGLSKEAMIVFTILPQEIQQQLFLERDPHGNVRVSLIESEKLFAALVADKLEARKAAGSYHGKFNAQHHFLGYEGRCGFPTNFDADYCYSLGYNAFMLIQYGYNGYLSRVSNLCKPASEWHAGGMPIIKMMNMERRNGQDKPVIKKALVELDSRPFQYFEAQREKWAVDTCFTYPGAIQYFGPAELCDRPTKILALEKGEETVRAKYHRLTQLLIRRKLTITSMESASSGQIASLITDTEGASAVLKGAFITYSNEAKIQIGVPAEIIEKYSVYSQETAKAMADCCRKIYQADIGIGVTGTLGNVDPENPEASVPGKVYFAFSFQNSCKSYELELSSQPSRLLYKLAVADAVYDRLMENLPEIEPREEQE